VGIPLGEPERIRMTINRAEGGGAITLFLVTYFGIPVSGAIVGVAAARKAAAARWNVARRGPGLDRDATRGGIVRRRFLRALQTSFLTHLRGVTLPGVMLAYQRAEDKRSVECNVDE
jgi:phosphate/sulfate permease